MDKYEMMSEILVYLVSVYMIFNIFLKPGKVSLKRLTRYTLYLIPTVIICCITWGDPKFESFGILTIPCFVVASFFFTGTCKEKIWAYMIGSIICDFFVTLELMIIYIPDKIMNYPIWFNNQTVVNLRAIPLYIILGLVLKSRLRKYNLLSCFQKATKLQTFMAYVFLSTISEFFVQIIYVYTNDSRYVDNRFAFSIVIMMSIGISAKTVMKTFVEGIYQVWNVSRERKQLERELGYYQKLDEINLKTRAYKHDMKNHIIIMKSLLTEGKKEELEKYMAQLYADVNQIDNLIRCGNSVIDAIINDKIYVAREKQIAIEFDVKVDQNISIPDTDLCSIFANSLDNAIEACEQIMDTEKRKIQLNAICDRGYLFYNIKNTASCQVHIRNNEVVTSKNDTINHGFGIRNIKHSVLKNAGNIQIKSLENEFSIEIDIPIGNEITTCV